MKLIKGFVRREQVTGLAVIGMLLWGLAVAAEETATPTVSDALPALDEQARLDDYLAYAALSNPGLEAAYYRWQAALEAIGPAGTLPDPRLSYAYFIEQVETRVGPQEQKLGVAQAFPWPSTLRLRSAVASAAASAAEQRYQALKLRLFLAVKDAYYELYYLSRSIAITADNIALLKHLESVAQANFMVGAPVSGVIKAQVELGKVDDRLRTLQDFRQPITARLNAALGRAVDAPIPWPEQVLAREITLDDQAIRESMASANPDLRRIDYEIAGSEQAIELAQTAFRPDFVVGLDWVDTGGALNPGLRGSGRDPLAVKFSVSLPIWRAKYRAGVRQAKNRRQAVQGARSDLKNNLESRLALSLYRFHDAERKIDLFRDTLVPLSEASLEVAQQGYEAGKEDFLNVIDAQRQLLEFQLAFERGLADREQHFAAVEMLVGRSLEPVTGAPQGEYR